MVEKSVEAPAALTDPAAPHSHQRTVRYDRYAPARVEAERLVRSSGLSYVRIADLLGLHPNTVSNWVRQYDWQRGTGETIGPDEATASAALGAGVGGHALAAIVAARPKRRRVKSRKIKPLDRAELIRRLYAAIEQNLQDLEQRMNDDNTPSAADGERDARTLSTAIRNLEKVTELEAGVQRDADGANRKRGGKLANDDADRIRLELAERILRIRAQRRAERAAGRGDNA